MLTPGAAPARSVSDDVVPAYDRAAVGDFLQAVEDEAERLSVVIDAARARAARARSLLHLHESMVATMADVCREATRRLAARGADS